MPKHIKDNKVGYYEYHSNERDEHGIVHGAHLEHVTDVWASVLGAPYSLEYNVGAWRNNRIVTVVFTRLRTFDPKCGDYILYKGQMYEIKDINDLTGEIGKDVKLTCEYDSMNHYQP
jgi:hypothetical protein